MKHFHDVVQTTKGTAIVGATVTVRVKAIPPASGALATIYSDNGVTTIAGSVVTTDSNGEFEFWAADGRYDLSVDATGGTPVGGTKVLNDVEVSDVTETATADSVWKVKTAQADTVALDAANADVVLTRSAADTLQLATGDKFIPQTSGQDLGSTTNRWDVYGVDADFSGIITGGALVTLIGVNVCTASTQTGADAGVKIAACITGLASTGGTVYADLSGAQTIATDVFTAVTKNVHLIFTSGQYSHTVSTTYPRNISIEMKQGATLVAPTGVTVTIRGSFDAPRAQVFTIAGTGKFQFAAGATSVNTAQGAPEVNAAWWGMNCDGVSGADGTTAIQAAHDSLLNGGVIRMDGYCVSNFPTLVDQGDWITFKGTGRWDLKTPITTIPRLAFIGEGSGATGGRQTAAYWTIAVDTNSYSANTSPLIKHNNAGPLYLKNVAFIYRQGGTVTPNAPTFQCVNGSSVNADNVVFQNDNSTNAASDAVELDGCFWLWFNQVYTSTQASLAGAVNYDLTTTVASAQDTGLVFIENSQMNGSGLRFTAPRSPTGIIGNTVVRNSTLESAVVSGVIIDVSTVGPKQITLDAFTNADSVSGVTVECQGTPVSLNDGVRGVSVLHNEGIGFSCGATQVEYETHGGPAFTGNFDPGAGQRLYALTNFGALDQRWLYSGGQFSPSWSPFAAPSTVPTQDATLWGAYTDTGAATTVTTGIIAPDGSTTAARFSIASGISGKYVDQNLTLAAGDWLVFGGWVRSNSTTTAPRPEVYDIDAISGCATWTNDSGKTATTDQDVALLNERRRMGSSIDWMPLNNIVKVVASVSNPCTIRFSMNMDSTRPTEFWKPFLIQIPASANIPDGAIIRAWRAGAFNNIYSGAAANAVIANPEAAHTIGALNGTEVVDGVRNKTIQAAHDALPANGGIIEVPPGTLQENGIVITKSVILRCAGPGGWSNAGLTTYTTPTLIENTSTGTDLLTVTPASIMAGFRIENCHFKGNEAVGGATAGSNIVLNSGAATPVIRNFELVNVVSRDAYEHGLEVLGNTFEGDIWGGQFISNRLDGINYTSVGGTCPATIRTHGAVIQFNLINGIDHCGGSAMDDFGSYIAANGEDGVVHRGGVHYHGTRWEGNGTAVGTFSNIKVVSGSGSIEGGLIDGSGTTDIGVWVTGGTRFRIGYNSWNTHGTAGVQIDNTHSGIVDIGWQDGAVGTVTNNSTGIVYRGDLGRTYGRGTALVAGDFALDANWGAGAAVSAVTGTDQAWQITITAAGVPANPATATLTFKDGTWVSAPICQAQVIGGTGAVADLTGLPTTTTWPVAYNGLPVAASTYIIVGSCTGR